MDYKVVILAGGYGTRLSEETEIIPKPLVEIGGRPILWHIMKLYSYYGFNDFIICCGYKGYLIKEYFHNYYAHNCDMTISLGSGGVQYHKFPEEQWNVTVVDTGLDSFTGERLLRIKDYIEDCPFFLTYGDGVSNVNISDLLHYHKTHGYIATCTTVKKASRFGSVRIGENNKIEDFDEKPLDDDSWINGGFFVFEPDVLNFVDDQMLEKSTLPKLSEYGHLVAYKHDGFWKAMDTLRDKHELESMWNDNPEWKVW